MDNDSSLSPVPKLDARSLLHAVNAATGAGLVLEGTARGGQVGAAFVRWPDGRPGVLTRGHGDTEALRQTADVLRIARERGIPAPRYELIQPVGDVTALVQKRLPGYPPARIDDLLVDAMIALNDRYAGLLAGMADVPALELYLTESGPGFCLHEPLERYDGRTRRLLDWVRDIGRQVPSALAGKDLVHADFHPGNVLVNDDGGITGVVDWDGAARGDRHFTLVTLAFDLHWGVRFNPDYDVSSEVLARLDARLDAMDPDVLRACWAHMSLRLVDWSIRHHTPEVVDHYLAFARARIDAWE